MCDCKYCSERFNFDPKDGKEYSYCVCLRDDNYLEYCFAEDGGKCRFYEPPEDKTCRNITKETPDSLPLPEGTIPLKGCTIALPKYSARISIGSLQINLTDKTFTEEQIKNMKEMLGWEVENL